MSALTVKEVKTLFTLDSKSLKEGMKDADKSVKALQKEFKDTQKQVTQFIKQLKDVKKELKDVSKDSELDLNTDEAISDINGLVREMNQVKRSTKEIKKEADDALKGLGSDKIDLSTFGRLQNLLKDMARIEVVNTSSIDKAQSKVRSLVGELKSVDTDVNITTKLEASNNFANDNMMRHWIDNNSNSSAGGAADDTQQALSRLISIASTIASNQSDLNIDEVKIADGSQVTGLSSDIKTIAKDVSKLSNGFREANQEIESNTDSTQRYEQQIQDLANAMMEFGTASRQAEFHMEDEQIEEFEDSLNDALDTIRRLNAETQYNADSVASVASAYSAITQQLRQVEAMHQSTNQSLNAYQEGLREAEENLQRINQLSSDNANERLEYTDEIEHNRRRLEIMQRVSRELDEQRNTLTNRQRQLREEHTQLVRNAGATQDQTDALEEQEQSGSRLKGIFKALADTLKPITNLFGFNDNRAVQNIARIGNAGQEAGQGLNSLINASGGASGGLTKLGAAGVAAAVAIGTLIVAVGSIVAGFKALYEVAKKTLPAFKDFESAIARTNAALLNGVQGAKDYGDALKEAFENQGYVDNINDFADAFTRVNQMLGSFDGVDTSKLTEDILTVAEVTKWDVNEISRTIKNMAVNMGVDVTSALDMVYSAWQQTGDPANDLLDTFNEYSSQFNKMGVGAQWAFDKIVKGLQAGVFNSDKIADSFKELYLRLADPADIEPEELEDLGLTLDDIANGADDVVNAFDKLGISTNQFKAEIAKGGKAAEDAIDTLVGKIADVEDKATQQNIIAALFGAPGEDMGSAFFEAIDKADEDLQDFNGSVEQSAEILESTLGYQLEQLGNTWQTFKSEFFDETFGPAVKEFSEYLIENLDAIKTKIESEVVPAFMNLAIAIVGPFVEGDITIDSFINGLITGIAAGINSIAVFIDVCHRIIAVFQLITNAIEIVWNVFQIMCIGFIKEFNTVVYSILGGIGFIADGVINFFGNFKTIMANCGIVAQNAGIAIKNFFGWAFNSVLKDCANTVNKMIDMLNLIPGTNIKKVTWGSNYKSEGFKELIAPTESYSNLYQTMVGKLNESNNTAANLMDKNIKDLDKDFKDIQRAWNTLTADSIEDRASAILADYAKLRAEQDAYTKAKENTAKAQDKLNKAEEKAKDKVSGKDVTAKDLDALKKAADAAKKAEEAAKKAADDAAKAAAEALKAQQEAIKKRIEWEKEYYDKKRSWQEAINSQTLALIEDDVKAIQVEIQLIQQLKDTYALTSDQMISYTQKQFDLAVKLRDAYTSKVEDALKDELEALKDKADDEYDIEHQKNQALIKDKERQIKAIDALMRENDYNNTQDDIDYEISQTEEEYQKYMFATSYEGIQKREELEETLRGLRLEKARNAQKQELEDKKQSLEDEISDIEDKDEAQQEEAERQSERMQAIYDDMFAELEELFEGGTTNIADIQKYAQQTNNSTIKGLLADYVLNYKNAMNEVQKYTLSMNQMQSWYQSDLNKDAANGVLTGDTDAVDKNNFIGNIANKDSAIKTYNALKKEHTQLSAKKVKTDADKARIKAIEKEVAEIRKVYGFTGYQIDGSHANGLDKVPYDGYVAEVHRGEAILKSQEADVWRAVKAIGLPNLSNVLNRQASSIDNVRTQSIVNNNVVNNNGPVLAIENFNNNSNADVRKIAYDINSNVAIRNRSKGRK